MVTLVEHAQVELDRLHEDPRLAANLLATIAAYSSFGHSGGSHECASELLMLLLRYRPLTPLTANPSEWIDRSEMSGYPMWQSSRDARAMSSDGGRTYTLVDDPAETATVYRTVAPLGWVRALRERDGYSEDAAKEAIWDYLAAGPLTEADRGVLESMSPREQTKFFLGRWGRAGAAVASLLYESPTDPAEPGLYA